MYQQVRNMLSLSIGVFTVFLEILKEIMHYDISLSKEKWKSWSHDIAILY